MSSPPGQPPIPDDPAPASAPDRVPDSELERFRAEWKQELEERRLAVTAATARAKAEALEKGKSIAKLVPEATNSGGKGQQLEAPKSSASALTQSDLHRAAARRPLPQTAPGKPVFANDSTKDTSRSARRSDERDRSPTSPVMGRAKGPISPTLTKSTIHINASPTSPKHPKTDLHPSKGKAKDVIKDTTSKGKEEKEKEKHAEALECYANAVELEQSGRLNDALNAYRRAYRLDSAVEKSYHRHILSLEKSTSLALAQSLSSLSLFVTDPTLPITATPPPIEPYRFETHAQFHEDYVPVNERGGGSGSGGSTPTLGVVEVREVKNVEQEEGKGKGKGKEKGFLENVKARLKGSANGSGRGKDRDQGEKSQKSKSSSGTEKEVVNDGFDEEVEAGKMEEVEELPVYRDDPLTKLIYSWSPLPTSDAPPPTSPTSPTNHTSVQSNFNTEPPQTTPTPPTYINPYTATFLPQDDKYPLHISKLPFEILDLIVGWLDVQGVERFGGCCRWGRVVTRDAGVWRDLCYKLYKPPILPLPDPSSPSNSSNQITPLTLAKRHALDWRTTFLEERRVRYDGVYISVCHYIRPGQSDLAWVNITHLITYHRFLRFYPDGMVISLLTTDHPVDVVHNMKPSLRAKGTLFGRWILTTHKDPTTGLETPSIEIRQMLEPGLNTPKYEFEMDLGLKTTTRGRWNKLEMRTYQSIRLGTGEALGLSLKHQKPFYFSKVRSYSQTL